MSGKYAKSKKSFDPFDDSLISDSLDGLFESHLPHGRSETGFLSGKSFRPATDIFENPDGLIFVMDLPGVDREQIDVKVENGHLVVYGARDFVKDHPDEEFVRLERGFGSFRRIFEIPKDVDTDRITAKMEKGVLTVIVPILREHRRINVEVKGEDG